MANSSLLASSWVKVLADISSKFTHISTAASGHTRCLCGLVLAIGRGVIVIKDLGTAPLETFSDPVSPAKIAFRRVGAGSQ